MTQTTNEAYGLCVGGNGKLMKALPMKLADENRGSGRTDVLPVKVLSITGSADSQAAIERFNAGEG